MSLQQRLRHGASLIEPFVQRARATTESFAAPALGGLRHALSQGKMVASAVQTSPVRQGLAMRLNVALRDEAFEGTLPLISIGALSALSSREQYVRLTTAMFAVYTTMESALDKSTSPAVRQLWENFNGELRRAPSLQADLKAVGAWPPPAPSMETTCFIRVIETAARSDEETGNGARLLGHIYCSHLADLAGARALAPASRRALGLSDGPRRYAFETLSSTPWTSFESVLASINEGGRLAADEDEIFAEAKRALRCTANVYSEAGLVHSGLSSFRALKNVAIGYRPKVAAKIEIVSAKMEIESPSADAAPSTVELGAKASVSAGRGQAKRPRLPASKPATKSIWETQLEAEEQLRMLESVDINEMSASEMRGCAGSLGAAFGADGTARQLAAHFRALAESREAHLVLAAATRAEHAKLAKLNAPMALAEKANLQSTMEDITRQLQRSPAPNVPDHRWTELVDAEPAKGAAAAAGAENKGKSKNEGKGKGKGKGKNEGKSKNEGTTSAPPSAPTDLAAVSDDDAAPTRMQAAFQVPWNSRGLDGGDMQLLLQRTSQQLDEMNRALASQAKQASQVEQEAAAAAADVEVHRRLVEQSMGHLKAKLEPIQPTGVEGEKM